MASCGKESVGRTMASGVQVRRAPAAAREKGPRTRWGFLRVQLRSSPLFRRGGGGCPGSGFLPGIDSRSPRGKGRRRGWNGNQIKNGRLGVYWGREGWKGGDESTGKLITNTTFCPRALCVSGAYL